MPEPGFSPDSDLGEVAARSSLSDVGRCVRKHFSPPVPLLSRPLVTVDRPAGAIRDYRVDPRGSERLACALARKLARTCHATLRDKAPFGEGQHPCMRETKLIDHHGQPPKIHLSWRQRKKNPVICLSPLPVGFAIASTAAMQRHTRCRATLSSRHSSPIPGVSQGINMPSLMFRGACRSPPAASSTSIQCAVGVAHSSCALASTNV